MVINPLALPIFRITSGMKDLAGELIPPKVREGSLEYNEV